MSKTAVSNAPFAMNARVRSVDLSDDGTLALTGSDAYKAKLWSMQTGEMLRELEFGNVVDTVAISPNAQLRLQCWQLR